MKSIFNGNLLKKITAVLLILALTMVDFLIVSINTITYAADLVQTNQKNVKFKAYFLNENGEENNETNLQINSSEAKLYLQVSVENSGYFNGQISLENSNFKLKEDILCEGISKISENTITLDKITAKETKTFEIGIEANLDRNPNISMLDNDSTVKISGIYTNEKGEEKSIESETEVKANIISSSTMASASLVSEVLTNKVYEINGESKRIVQVLLKSKLDGVDYPIKNTNIEIEVPEKVTNVYSVVRNLNTTEKDVVVNNEDGKLVIDIENKANEENKIRWEAGEDILVVTYELKAEDSIEQIKASSIMTLYDDVSLKGESIVNFDSEKDGIISYEVSEEETSIYKGKIYAGEERIYRETVSINVDYLEVASKIELTANKASYLAGDLEKEANIKYNQIALNKEDVKKIFGEDGYITIKNQNNTIIANINANSEVNEEGNVLINMPEGTTSVKFETSKPVALGTLKIQVEKAIAENGYSREEITSLNYIKNSVTGKYTSNKVAQEGKNSESKIELKQTKTQATLDINKATLSTLSTNEDVEFTVVLNTKGEDKDLYKNPTISIELPEEVETIKVKSSNFIYNGDELKIVSAKIVTSNGRKYINVVFEGEQHNYKEDTLDGATLKIIADITLDKRATTKQENITLTYTNENAIAYENDTNQIVKTIDLIAPTGMITENTIEEYGIQTFGEEEIKTIDLEKAVDSKQITTNIELINNEESSVNNIKVLGQFLTKNEANTIETKIVEPLTVEGIDQKKVEIYYTENANATNDLSDSSNNWVKEISDNTKVSKYLILIDSMQISESIKATYVTEIPENLGYNETAEEGYTVSYTKALTQAIVEEQATTLELTTGTGPVVEAKLTASVGGNTLENGATVYEGEIIKYRVEAKNVGNEDSSNINIKAQIPEGTTYVTVNEEYNEYSEDDRNSYYIKHEDVKEYQVQSEKIAKGETLYTEYEVIVNKASQSLLNKAEVTYNEAKAMTEEISLVSQESDLAVTVSTEFDERQDEIESGVAYTYNVRIDNTSDKEKKNVSAELNISDLFELTNITILDTDSDDEEYDQELSEEELQKTFTIESIPANSSKYILVELNVRQPETIDNQNATVSIDVKDGEKTYRSNEIKQVVQTPKIEVIQEAKSSNGKDFVDDGEQIEYTFKITNTGNLETDYGFMFNDEISGYLSIESIKQDDQDVEDVNLDGNTVNMYVSLSAGQSTTIKILTKVNAGSKEPVKVENYAELEKDEVIIATTEKTTFTINPLGDEATEENNKVVANPGEQDTTEPGIEPENPTNPTPETPETPQEQEKTYIITGTAWLDENENGVKDSSEQTLSDITVKLLDVKNGNLVTDSEGKEISVKTDKDGYYAISSVKPGQYIVIFEYDTDKYILTIYKVEGGTEKDSSDATLNTLTINGTSKEVASTDIITISDSSIANIDVGLREAKKFDLELSKTISRVVVQTSDDTKTYDYNDSKLAKVEIAAKKLKGATILVEYKIKVTNNGELAGFAKNIVDYMPKDLSFKSELNKDWYQSEENLYNNSLANEKIEAGQSKELTLVLTKTMTEENTGIINNIAEINVAYNNSGILDIDSTPGNKIQGEDDLSSADLIIGVKTGAVVTYIALTLSIIIVIGAGAYIFSKKYLRKRI